eukprot:2845888-Rhodomonas_salina.1
MTALRDMRSISGKGVRCGRPIQNPLVCRGVDPSAAVDAIESAERWERGEWMDGGRKGEMQREW